MSTMEKGGNDDNKQAKSDLQGGKKSKTKPEGSSKSECKNCDWCGESWDEAISGPFRPAPDVKALVQFFHTVEGLAGRGMSLITRAYPEINNPATMKRIQKLKVHFPSPEEVAHQQYANKDNQSKGLSNMPKQSQQQQQQQQQPPRAAEKSMRTKAEWKPRPSNSTSRFGSNSGRSGINSSPRYNPIQHSSKGRLRSSQPRWQSKGDFDERSIWVGGHNESYVKDMRNRLSPIPSIGSRMDSGRNMGYSPSVQMDKSSNFMPYSSSSSSFSMQPSYLKDSFQGNVDMMDRGWGPSPVQQSSQWSSTPTPLMEKSIPPLDRSIGNVPYGTPSTSAASDESMQRLLMSVMKGSGGSPQSMHDQEVMQRMLQQLVGMQGSHDGSLLGRQGGMM